jgi:hypothetical protein
MNTPRLALTAGLALTTACAGLESPQPARVLDARLMVGNMAARNSFELRNQPAEPRPADARVDTERRRPVTPILFWLGIGMTAVGGVSTVATGAAGFATQRQIINGYRDNITVEDRRTLEDRGYTLNKITIASAVVTVIGAVLTAVVYGYDYTNCGPLAPKRRRDNAPPGRCAAADNK